MNIYLSLGNSDTLVEYIYYDSTAPEIIDTDTAPLYLMENLHVGGSSLTQADGLESVTNNTRNRSVVEIDPLSKKYALLTTNKLGPAYNDYDNQLSNTNILPITFTEPEGIKYDTVRIHFIQGFTFTDFFSGIHLDISINDKDNNPINLLNVVYRVEDNYDIMNPNPFIYSGRQYSTYVEYKVPSLRYLLESYDINDTDKLVYKITNGRGLYNNTLIGISTGKISNITKLDNQLYTNRISGEETSISSQDEFSDVGVYINESTSGDYIEFYGTYSDAIFSNYMERLNSSGTGSYIAIHKLSITEQLPNNTGQYNIVGNYNPLSNIPDLSDNTYLSNFSDGDYWQASQTGYNADIGQNVNKGNFVVYNPNLAGSIKVEVIDSYDIENYSDIAQFVRTADLEFIQDDITSFGEPNNFRPVLKYGGSSLSYKIDYTLQIFNINTSSTIEKQGSYVSFYPQKYGKELIKINTRDNIQIFDVFNKKVTTTINQTNMVSNVNNIEDTSLYSKNLTSFKQLYNIYSGITEVSINVNGQIVPRVNPESVTNIKGQGTATVYISPFDTFLQFGIYEQIEDKSFRSIDLTKIGELYLNFTNKRGEIIKITSIKNQNVDESKGQVLFRIKPEIYNLVINSGNDVFFVTSKVGNNSPETPLYTGKYKEYAKIVEDETTILIGNQRQTINDLNDDIDYLEKLLRNANKKLANFPKTKVGPTGKRKEGSTASNKSVNKKAMNVKTSTFNPFGPSSPTSNSGPTSIRIAGPTNR